MTTVYPFTSFKRLVQRLRDDLKSQDFVLLYAYNGTGKTRLSMEFKEAGKKNKKKRGVGRDTLYFNAYTEDLFIWDNDLQDDRERKLQLNTDSQFFNGFKELALEEKIFTYLERYASFDFKIDYEKWQVSFYKDVPNPVFERESERVAAGMPEEKRTVLQATTTNEYIKISRGEENIFIWCTFLAICELVIDGSETYSWVKYLYIDDPISSLDDNNSIAVASDLAQLLKKSKSRQLKTVISSHHSLFFNVMWNEFKSSKSTYRTYFYHRATGTERYTLQSTEDTPFFEHVAMLSELKRASESGKIYTYHFNMLRSILEKTASFFGFDRFSDCIKGIDDEILYNRALNLLSHGKHSIYQPREMGNDTKALFQRVLDEFLEHYRFQLPQLLTEESNQPSQP